MSSDKLFHIEEKQNEQTIKQEKKQNKIQQNKQTNKQNNKKQMTLVKHNIFKTADYFQFPQLFEPWNSHINLSVFIMFVQLKCIK